MLTSITASGTGNSDTTITGGTGFGNNISLTLQNVTPTAANSAGNFTFHSVGSSSQPVGTVEVDGLGDWGWRPAQ